MGWGVGAAGMGVGLLPEATGSGLRGEDRTGGVPGQSGSLSPGWKTRHPRHPQEPSYFRVRLPHVHKYDFNCAKSRGVIPAAGRAGAGGIAVSSGGTGLLHGGTSSRRTQGPYGSLRPGRRARRPTLEQAGLQKGPQPLHSLPQFPLLKG